MSPSVAKLGNMLAELLEAARPKSSVADEFGSIEQQTSLWTSLLPRPEAKEELKKLEARLARAKERERREAQAKSEPAPPVPQKIQENEVVVQGEPYPIEYDRDLKRVACRIQHRIKGPAYETINAVRGYAIMAAVYTVQPSRDSWIVELISASGTQ